MTIEKMKQIDWFFVACTTDGLKHDTLEAAQAHEIKLILSASDVHEQIISSDNALRIGQEIVAHSGRVIAILKTKPGQAPKRKPRKDKGIPRRKESNETPS